MGCDAFSELGVRPIVSVFQPPAGPIRDDASAYLQAVTRTKTRDKKSASVPQWKDDGMFISSNAIMYNGKGSPLSVMAADPQSPLRELVKSRLRINTQLGSLS
jgi:hypothetical protein